MRILKELKLYKMEEIDGSDQDEFDDELDDGSQDDDLELLGREDSEGGDDFSGDDDLLSDDGDEDLDFDNEFSGIDSEDEFSDDEFSDDMDGEDQTDELSDDPEGEGAPQDGNYQGNVRNVPGAMLIYKKEAEDSTFEELWIYNVGKDIKQETSTRRAILNGTDISPQNNKSKDNKQTAKVTSIGNVQFLNIFGLPN